MIGPLLAGSVAGLGLLVLVLAVRPRRPGLAATLQRLDAARDVADPGFALRRAAGLQTGFTARLGRRLAILASQRGWKLISVKQDLAMTGKTLESHLANKVMLAAFGLLLLPILSFLLLLGGIEISAGIPLVGGLAIGALFFFLPDLSLRSEATDARKDFRHAVGSFLDLVAMNLSGGRGVPEALTATAQIGSGPSITRLRDTLAFARLQGLTPWAALGRLGHEVGLEELVDLSSALALVADDGAKVRESLSARAASMRRRELAESEGEAGERSQTMLVAQLLLCAAFLIFLGYPAVARVFAV